jgi:hypothetical protein
VGCYEQLRTVALAGGAGGHTLGLGLVMGRGLPAWMAAWRTVTPSAAPASLAPQPPAATAPAVVVVLAAMAIGLLQDQQAAAGPKGVR